LSKHIRGGYRTRAPKTDALGPANENHNHLKLRIFRPELMIDFLPNAVEYYARACPSLKTFKRHIGIIPTVRRWGLVGGPHDCDKLKGIAAPAVKLCDKVVFEFWEEVVIPQ